MSNVKVQHQTARVVTLAQLNTLPGQAPWRANPDRDRKLEELAEDISANGLMYEPTVTVVDGAYYKLDGHRRCAACAMLGWKTIRAKVIEARTIADAQRRFVELNGTTLKLRGAEMFYMWAHAMDPKALLTSLKGGTRRYICRMVEIFGEREAKDLANAKTDLSVVCYTDRARMYFERWPDLPCPKARAIGYWIIGYKSTALINELVARRDKSQARRLIKAIEENQPMRVVSRKARGT